MALQIFLILQKAGVKLTLQIQLLQIRMEQIWIYYSMTVGGTRWTCGFVYTFVVDSSTDFDVTLAWVDREASIIANQSAVKLVNDLDLTATSPDGTVYHGNVFSNGFRQLEELQID